MDIEKLIERLRNNNIENNCHDCALGYYAFEAATALSTLQAENEKLRAELKTCKEKNAGLALALLTECAPNPDCLGDDEWRAIRVELERVKRERGAAIADWQGFCAKCVWNGKQYLSDGKMDDRCKTCRDNNKCNWEWRGIKED